MTPAGPAGASSGSRPATSWLTHRLLALVVLVVAAVPAVVLRGGALAAATAVLLALLLAAVVQLWQRQTESLRREQELLHLLRSLRADVGVVDQAAQRRGEPRSLREEVHRLETSSRGRHDAVRQAVTETERHLRLDVANDFRQVEATLNLFSQLPAAARMPGLRGWAISPDLMLVLVELVRQRRPGLVVELGGGSSTVWLAQAIRTLGLDTRVVTLEHDLAWVATVRARLEAHGLAHLAEVRHAPLVDQVIDGSAYPWYDPSGWKDLRDIDLVVVDGPPALTGKLARYPALPLLRDLLSSEAVIVLDDAVRPDEQQIARDWTPLLDGFERLDLPVEKRAIIFHRGPALAL